MDPSLGIMAAVLVICGGIALFVDDRRRSLAEENQELRDALARARTPVIQSETPQRWTPPKRKHLEAVLVGGWKVNPPRQEAGSDGAV